MSLPGATRFSAVLAAEPDGRPGGLAEWTIAQLDEGDVLVEVDWSSLNYKDALAVTGSGRVVRRFPMIAGVDLAGVVLESSDDRVAVGDDVVVTGCGLGESHHGGLARYARVPASWCVIKPPSMSARRAMVLGTAGVTAMLSVMALEHDGLTPEIAAPLPVLVTGAAGGVGSLAVALLDALGYEVLASTGRTGERGWLTSLGATEVVERAELEPGPARPLEHERWAGAIDVVGGPTLASVLAGTRATGTVAACGLVGGAELETTVLPFILRGVTLAGVNSVHLDPALRRLAWDRLARQFPLDALDSAATAIPLEDVETRCADVLAGKVRGRLVVDLGGR